MKFGLPDTTIENIQTVFENHAKIDEVIVFGSRAKGNYKEGSDIDLAVKGRNISFDDILKLLGQLDDLNLPYEIDLLDYVKIKEKAVVEHIDRVGIVFYERLNQSEFGFVASNWGFIPASQYCLKVTDGTHDSPKEQKAGKHLITSRHIKERNIDFENAYKISEDNFNKINLRSKVDQWDVIISMIGEYCGFSYVERNNEIDYAVKNVGLFKTGDETKAFWLFYFLNSKIGKSILEASKSGTSQPYITLNALRELPILIPKTETETIEIINVLRSLDDKIDLLQRQNKTLEQLAETLFRQWFVEEADESWEVKFLKNIAEHVKININPPKHPDTYFYHYSLPAFDEGKNPQLEIGKDILSNKYKVVPNSILVSKLNPRFPRIWSVYRNNIENNSICSTEFQVVKPKHIVYFGFIYFFLKSNQASHELMNAAGGTSGSHQRVNPEDIFNLSFYNPSKDLIAKFDEQTSSYFQKINYNTIQIKQLTQLRDALLPKLMSGEVKIQR